MQNKPVLTLILAALFLVSCNVPTSRDIPNQPSAEEKTVLWDLSAMSAGVFPSQNENRDSEAFTSTATPQLIKPVDFEAAFHAAVPLSTSEVSSAVQTGDDRAVWLFFEPAEFSASSMETLYVNFRNDGESTWTSDYYLEYYAGINPSDSNRIRLQTPSEPGERASFLIPISDTSASWKSCWQLKNSAGAAFYEFCYNHGDGLNDGSGSGSAQPAQSAQGGFDPSHPFYKTNGSAPAKFSSEEQAAEVLSTNPENGHTFQAYDHFESLSVSIQNNGTEAWDSSYSLVFYSGYNWMHQTAFPIAGTVESGETVQITMPMEIYEDNDKWITCWYLSTPDGKNLSDFCFRYYTKS